MMNELLPTSQLISAEDRADIQGFITSSFGHLRFSAYAFVRFNERSAAREWLRRLLPAVTTAASWRTQPGAPKQPPPRALNLSFTAEGLRVLGLPEECVGTFPPEFLEGMASGERARILGDTGESAAERWELGGPQNPPIHALLILSAETSEGLQADCGRVLETAENSSAVALSSIEFGTRPLDDKEPFGFRDGVARLQIKGITRTGVNAGEFILGYENEYGYRPVSPLLAGEHDPRGGVAGSRNPFHQGRDFGRNGTFLVYRKLEQDVAGFWRFMEAESLRRRGEADPGFMVWLAAKMVGRWPSGAPLVLAPEGDCPALSESDDFLYAAADPAGMRCPFGAHIRRTNPRDQIRPAGPVESLHMTARHRLLRRGKPYGTRPLFDLAALDNPSAREALRQIVNLRHDGHPRGLHFLCVSASIKSQFEFIQQTWCNNPHFNGLTGNRDPLIGGGDAPGENSSMLVPREDLDLRTASLPRFVTLRGGGYFFMPGLRATKFLSGWM